MKQDVIVIVGPTASSKSSISIELAKIINGEIISADSMQIYKNLDIGTAKITKEENSKINHELIDIVDISESFSVSEYKKMCYEKIEEIIKRKKTPIIVGGTGLYINAVVNNMQFANEDSTEIKNKIAKLKEENNSEELYKLLLKLDKESAKNISEGNTKRVLRAIELYYQGTLKSDVEKRKDLWEPCLEYIPYNFLIYYIDLPRDLLYDRINKRIDSMMTQGLLAEAKYVYENYKLNPQITAAQAIGYKELFPLFEGKTASVNECVEVLKRKTRNYAKRQITWFKKLKNKKIIDGNNKIEIVAKRILKEYYEEKQ